MSEKKKRCRVQGAWASATGQRLMWQVNKGSSEFQFQPNKPVCKFCYLLIKIFPSYIFSVQLGL